jgi:hypothetical protein
MRSIVAARTFWRPIRSPSEPNTTPPSGRTAKAAAKVPKVARTCEEGSPGKKTAPSVTARKLKML